jgi:hypothetical protein
MGRSASTEIGSPSCSPHEAEITDIWGAARWADRLIYLKIVSERRAQLTFGRQRYVQTIER